MDVAATAEEEATAGPGRNMMTLDRPANKHSEASRMPRILAHV
jgi:hypothetical protein